MATPTDATPAAAAAAAVPFSAKGGIAHVQDPAGSGDTRIYYQPTDTGIITEYSVSDVFDVGRTVGTGPLRLVPPAEALQGTPIAAVLFPGYTELHVFFISPTGILSEYYWKPGGWHGGPNCADCITRLGIPVSAANKNSLFATFNASKNVLAVGFFLSPNPGTLSEAIRRGGRWIVAPLPA